MEVTERDEEREKIHLKEEQKERGTGERGEGEERTAGQRREEGEAVERLVGEERKWKCRKGGEERAKFDVNLWNLVSRFLLFHLERQFCSSVIGSIT